MMRRCVPFRLIASLLLVITCYVQRQLFINAFILPQSLLVFSRRTNNQKTISSGNDNILQPSAKHINRITINQVPSRTITHHKASPSGIDEWPQIAQAGVFFGSYAALALITYPTTKLLETFSQSAVIGLEKWRIYVIDSTLPITMGLVYLLGGIGHFAAAESFQDIYPPNGTWGIWYLPGSAAFHVAWTGIVELLGGAGLIYTGIRDAIGSDDAEEENTLQNFIKPICASILFLLTILVTPANIYMFTHGAVMGDMPPLDLSLHAIRFAVQVVFITLLFTLARDSFFYAWGDELD